MPTNSDFIGAVTLVAVLYWVLWMMFRGPGSDKRGL